MVRMILPILLLCFGIGSGITAAIFIPVNNRLNESTNSPGNAEVSEMLSDDEHQDSQNHDMDTEAYLPVRPGSNDALEYVRLNNQFVVPVVQDSVVRSLVVMSLTIEVHVGENERVFSREPRLRDAFLRVMFRHANSGGFDGRFTTPIALNPLRAGLRDAARDVLGTIVHDVLIVDIVRQDA